MIAEAGMAQGRAKRRHQQAALEGDCDIDDALVSAESAEDGWEESWSQGRSKRFYGTGWGTHSTVQGAGGASSVLDSGAQQCGASAGGSRSSASLVPRISRAIMRIRH